MILTCPRCATRFLVEAQEIPPDGRRVRCSECGQEWRVQPEALEAEAWVEHPHAPEPEAVGPATAEAGFVPEPALESEPPAAPPVAEAPAHPDPQAPEPPLVAPIATSRTARPRTRAREGSPVLAIVLVLGVVVLAAILAVGLRGQVVRAWPASARIYRSLGVPTDGTPPPGAPPAHG